MKSFVLMLYSLCLTQAFFATIAASTSARRGVKSVSKLRTVKMQASATGDQSDNFDGKVTSGSFNLAKNVLGAGVLSLSSGVGCFTDVKSGLLPACALTVAFGSVSKYAFKLIGETCAKTNSETLQEAWTKLVGSGAGLVGASVTALTFGAALAYSIILAESFSALGVTFNAPAFMQSRNNCLLVLTTGILLPLCSLKSLAALAPLSILGLLGILYTAAMMTVRLLDGSYAAGGALVDTIAAAAKPSFGKKGMNLAKTLMLTSMLSTNFICHYNAPRFLKEIKVSSVSQTLRRYNKMADQGFMGSIVFSMLMMSLGFLTFGGNTMGYILNNYASGDVLASFARFAIACALITSYPLAFLSLRDGIFDMLEVNPKDREKLHYLTTISTLGLLTSLAWVLHDVGFVVSIMGAIFGSWLIFGIPCILKNAYIKKEAVKENRSLTFDEKKSIVLNKGLMGTGSVLSVLGVFISIMQQLGRL